MGGRRSLRRAQTQRWTTQRGSATAATMTPCANPTCLCQATETTCSSWCAILDRPADARCQCRHDGCARPLARTLPSPSRDRAPASGNPRLLVVRRDCWALYMASRELFAEERCVVILDRRQGERRRNWVAVGTERRRADRRCPPAPEEHGRWQRLGYRFAYPGGASRVSTVRTRPTTL